MNKTTSIISALHLLYIHVSIARVILENSAQKRAQLTTFTVVHSLRAAANDRKHKQ